MSADFQTANGEQAEGARHRPGARPCSRETARNDDWRDTNTRWKSRGLLGSVYAELPTGDRARNLRLAIAAFEAALRVWTENDFPFLWASAHNGSVLW